jgi:hypothetical protein
VVEGLKDVKPLAKIEDFSFELLVSIIIFLLLLAFASLIIFLKNKNKSISLKKRVYERLVGIDLNDTKKAAYKITKYGRFLAKSKTQIEIFKSLEKKLERYKYKKRVEKFDEEVLKEYNLLVEVLGE